MIRTEPEFVAFVAEVLAFSDMLAQRLGIHLEIIDFGGSLATPSVAHIASMDYRLNRTLLRDLPAPDVAAVLGATRYVSILKRMVDEHFSREGYAAQWKSNEEQGDSDKAGKAFYIPINLK